MLKIKHWKNWNSISVIKNPTGTKQCCYYKQLYRSKYLSESSTIIEKATKNEIRIIGKYTCKDHELQDKLVSIQVSGSTIQY